MENKTKGIGAAALIFGGGWLADKTMSYIWEGILNLLTAGMADQVTWETFPVRNAVGVTCIIAGIVVLIWPSLQRTFSRRPLGEEKVLALIEQRLGNQPKLTSDANEVERRVLAHINQSISPQIKQLGEDLGALWSQLLPTLEANKKAKAAQLASRLKSLMRPKPDLTAAVASQWSRQPGGSDMIKPEMNSLGISDDERASAQTAATQEIMQDILYASLAPGEECHWKSGTDKRNWYIENARFEADLALLKSKGLIFDE